MKKIIMLLLGVALIVGLTIFLVKPKEAIHEAEQVENSLTDSFSTKEIAPSYKSNSVEGEKRGNNDKKKITGETKERLYTKEELDAAVSKAEVEMAEKVLRETISEEEITEKVDSVVDAFENSSQTAASGATQATINNYIHENGIYDKLAEEGVIFSGVECREVACKLNFEVSDTDDNLERRMPKMFSISEELSGLEILEDMEAIITNDFEGRSLQYYYY